MKNHFLKLLSLTAVISIFFWADAYTDSQPSVGEIAPTFKLQDQNGDWHTLEDYKGQYVVLFFYPKDGTPGCTTEACNFRDNIFAFDDLDTQILGISLDDVESHKEFSEKYSLPYPILADVEKESAVSYGVLGKFLMNKGVRNPQEIEAGLGLSVYATIPHSDFQKELQKKVKFVAFLE